MPRPLSRIVRTVARDQLHFDPVGMAGDGFVHSIVEYFRGEVMQGALIGAADIHARPPANRLQPFQDLDVLGSVTFGGGGSGVEQIRIFCHRTFWESRGGHDLQPTIH